MGPRTSGMEQRLTEQDGKMALRDHVAATALRGLERYGPAIDAEGLLRLLTDRSVVRFPVEIRFGTERLRPGEPGFPEPVGERPSDGYRLWLHPALEARRELWPVVVSYYLASVNYGPVVSADDAELFGATLLNLDIETYYLQMCALADWIASLPGSSGDLP
ncbi:MAG: hypothetical protein IPJ41_07670 [Phycisphaerales bacterium]|nr:hypothetical protein [Phycisphaerales bacterium]